MREGLELPPPRRRIRTKRIPMVGLRVYQLKSPEADHLRPDRLQLACITLVNTSKL
jgi:hypothetical protein